MPGSVGHKGLSTPDRDYLLTLMCLSEWGVYPFSAPQGEEQVCVCVCLKLLLSTCAICSPRLLLGLLGLAPLFSVFFSFQGEENA